MGTTGPGSGDHLPLRTRGTATPEPGDSTSDNGASAPKQWGCWGLAFERLSDKDRVLIETMAAEQSVQSFDPEPSPPTSPLKLDQLINLTAAKMDDCDKKAWKVPIPGGRQIILRDVAAKIIGWLDTFKSVGDTAVQYDPVSAALPWTAVRFFIQASIGKEPFASIQRGRL
ncbi:ankyrin repeat protein [Colletotrichum musicola]|uniref:Ankyrin repeat protein n=1 Tax=Colletotrichum musicola TaxID=2175873 RepID=A0A8H6JBE6_9PEZI|nr:ankyrin repeat protein [Colletotrichum musicola]